MPSNKDFEQLVCEGEEIISALGLIAGGHITKAMNCYSAGLYEWSDKYFKVADECDAIAKRIETLIVEWR